MQAVKSCVQTATPVGPAHCSDLSASGFLSSFFTQDMEEPDFSLSLRNQCVCVFLGCVYCIHVRPVMVCVSVCVFFVYTQETCDGFEGHLTV